MVALLEYLTEQICDGEMTPEQARAVVLLANKDSKAEKAKEALRTHDSAEDAARAIGVSKATLYRMAARA